MPLSEGWLAEQSATPSPITLAPVEKALFKIEAALEKFDYRPNIYAINQNRRQTKNIGLVVIMWSEWPRLDFETGEGYLGWNTFHPHRANSLGKFPINIEAKQNISKYLNFKAKSMKSLRTFFLAQELLKNVQYLMIQGTEEFAEDVSFGKLADGSFKTFKAGPADHEIGIKEFISHPLFKKIDENKFIGWPIFKRIGGYNIDSLLDKLDPSGKIYRMSMEDTHPNKKGHQYIGEMLFNEYKNIYL